MQQLWQHGPMSVRELVEHYPEPRPHANTVSTLVRLLEQKGHVGHVAEGGAHRYHAVTPMERVRRTKLTEVIRNYFANSSLGVVSELVKQEKITPDQLRELIDMVEQGGSAPKD